MTKTKPQMLTVKSKLLSDITVWRTRSLPLLDGDQGEHTSSPVPASHVVRFVPPDPNGHHPPTPPLPKGYFRSGPTIVSVGTPYVMPTSTVPPVIVDHGTSPDGNRLPLEREDHGTSPDGNSLPLATAPLVVATSTVPLVIGEHGTYPNRYTAPRACLDDDLKQTRLCPPRMNDNTMVTGTSTPRHRIENKLQQRSLQAAQLDQAWWSKHKGDFLLPLNTEPAPPRQHTKQMWPQGLATNHPAGKLLLAYATAGCPVLTGAPWTPAQMQAVVERGPHESAMLPEAMEQLRIEVLDKVKQGQARLVDWDDIRQSPPPELKISPVAMIPHKSRPFRAILDLSFSLRLTPSTSIPSINANTNKTAPRGAIDQLGHSLA